MNHESGISTISCVQSALKQQRTQLEYLNRGFQPSGLASEPSTVLTHDFHILPALHTFYSVKSSKNDFLLYCIPVSRLDRTSNHIISCCVLHNLCIRLGDEWGLLPEEQEEDNNNGQNEDNTNRETVNGKLFRDQLLNTYF